MENKPCQTQKELLGIDHKLIRTLSSHYLLYIRIDSCDKCKGLMKQKKTSRYPLNEICENDQSQCEPKNLKKQFVFENQKVENSVD